MYRVFVCVVGVGVVILLEGLVWYEVFEVVEVDGEGWLVCASVVVVVCVIEIVMVCVFGCCGGLMSCVSGCYFFCFVCFW